MQIPLTLAVNASSETARKQNKTHLLVSHVSVLPLQFSSQSQCDFGHTHPVAISPVDGELADLANVHGNVVTVVT